MYALYKSHPLLLPLVVKVYYFIIKRKEEEEKTTAIMMFGAGCSKYIKNITNSVRQHKTRRHDIPATTAAKTFKIRTYNCMVLLSTTAKTIKIRKYNCMELLSTTAKTIQHENQRRLDRKRSGG